MEATEVFIKDILRCREFPVGVVKSYETDAFIDAFVMCIKQLGLLAPKRICLESENLLDKLI